MSNKLHAQSTDTEILQALGERLRELRRARGLSQDEAARRSGVSRRTLYNAEHGNNPRLRTVIRLLRTYGRVSALEQFIPEAPVSPIRELDRHRGFRV